MNLIFYKTGFDITKNGMYENIDAYLSTLTPVADFADYKYVEPALETRIKLPIFTSHLALKGNVGDYMVAYDKETDDKYYYYVTGCKWRGKETVEVTLALDTLTTFQDRINASMTDESHITRKFKDRFWLTKTTAYPKIDDKDEAFSAVPMKQVSKEAVKSGNMNWTLVYLTEYTSDENLKNNPITCYAFPSTATKTNTGLDGIVTLLPTSISGANRYYMSMGMNEGDTLTITRTTGDTMALTVGGDGCKSLLFYPMQSASDTTKLVFNVRVFIHEWQQSDYTDYECSSITFTSCKQVWMQSTSFTGLAMDADYTNPYAIKAGEAYITLISFNDWYQASKTDGRLVKIRELPYAPFQESYTSGRLVVPSGWEIAGNILKFVGARFGSYRLGTTGGHALPTLNLAKDIVDTTPSIERETKLYNSSFYGDKLVYDSSTWVAQWERYNDGEMPNDKLSLSVNYAVSDGIDNEMLFEVNEQFNTDTDFGQFMPVDKNTDIPYFTNDYLNYIRYGKEVDEKAAALNVASSVVSGLGSAATTVASFAFSGATIGAAGGPGGAVGGAILGTVVGLITTTMSVTKTCMTAYDTINSKIDAYTHQASSVSGTSDLSLFRIYSGNKLLNILYEPIPDIKEMLYQYFRQFGYACDEYGLPKSSRRYVDYFQVTPVFQGDFMWNDFLNDVKQRMQLGYRVYHLVDNAYDLSLKKENWETTLWEAAHGS